MKKILNSSVLIALLVLSSTIQAQSGGNFSLTDAVIAGGAELVSSPTFSINGTSGQSLAGGSMANGSFAVTSGFWNYAPLAPTAANAAVGGRVTTANGNGIRNAHVTLIAPSGSQQNAITGAFGYFLFEDIPVGETYIVAVFSKRFTFNQPTQVRAVLEDISDVNFIAEDQ